MSARIGEAEDGLENGIISGVNLLAKALGIENNMAVKEAVKLIVI
jgi:nucleotidyltransferase/DNA polymerase involved in DNA repair